MLIKQKIKSLLHELDKHSPWPVLYDFIMSKEEKMLFDKTVRSSKNYLEFGAGGSTLRVLRKSAATIASIDSSAAWISSMQQYYLVRKMEKYRLTFYHMDIGPTVAWGAPANEDNRALFPSYSSTIFRLVDKSQIDTVLIDGRFRVACALKTILECHGNRKLSLLIHDFWNREHYHVLLKYLDESERAFTLGLFTIKQGISLDAVRNEYEAYQFNSA